MMMMMKMRMVMGIPMLLLLPRLLASSPPPPPPPPRIAGLSRRRPAQKIGVYSVCHKESRSDHSYLLKHSWERSLYVMQPPPPTQQGSSRTSGDGSSPQLPSMVSLLAPKLLVIQQRIRVSMCSQFLSSELQQLERFIGIEEEHQEGVEGGEGELLCPNLDIEQLDFKDSVSHPRLRLLSVERKRNSREIFVSFQDKKCLFLCCLCETSSYLATGYVKLAEVTLHGLLATAFTWEEGLLIDFEEITGHTASFLQAVRKARSPFFLLPRGSALSQCVRYCRGKWETWVSPTGDILLQEGNSAQAPLPGECANHEAIV